MPDRNHDPAARPARGRPDAPPRELDVLPSVGASTGDADETELDDAAREQASGRPDRPPGTTPSRDPR